MVTCVSALWSVMISTRGSPAALAGPCKIDLNRRSPSSTAAASRHEGL
jgi:hypothetical protein